VAEILLVKSPTIKL